MSPKVLVTGATGFIGSALAKKLSEKNYQVLGLSRSMGTDLSEAPACEKVLKEFNPDFIIHCAGYVQPGRKVEDFSRQIQNTLLPAIHLAQFASPQVKLLAFLGTCEEYGHSPVPFLESATPDVFSPYGWGKISALSAIKYICNERKVPWTWLRPFLTFGPGMRNRNLLIPSIIDACLQDKEVPLTLGEQTRDFIFIEDLMVRILRIIEAPEAAHQQVLNLCSGEPRAIRDVAQSLQAIIAKGRLALGKIPYRSNEVMNFYGSTAKFEKLYGKIPLLDFPEALRRTIGESGTLG